MVGTRARAPKRITSNFRTTSATLDSSTADMARKGLASTCGTDEAAGTTLCTSCGLCCAGALHNAAVLDEDEIAGAHGLGLPVLDRAKASFGLPCPKLSGTMCSIYGSRPRVCGRYRCHLLQRLDAGEVSLEDAIVVVQTAKSLIGELEHAMPRRMTLPQARALALVAASPGEADRPRDSGSPMRLRLAATAVVVYMDKHFRNAREGKLLKLRTMHAGQEELSDG